MDNIAAAALGCILGLLTAWFLLKRARAGALAASSILKVLDEEKNEIDEQALEYCLHSPDFNEMLGSIGERLAFYFIFMTGMRTLKAAAEKSGGRLDAGNAAQGIFGALSRTPSLFERLYKGYERFFTERNANRTLGAGLLDRAAFRTVLNVFQEMRIGVSQLEGSQRQGGSSGGQR